MYNMIDESNLKPFNLYVNYPMGSICLSHLSSQPILCYTAGDLSCILDADSQGCFITASKVDGEPSELPMGALAAIELYPRPWLIKSDIDFIDWM